MPIIGVAIGVPNPWGQQLQDYRCALGDTSANGIPTHVTLLGPTEVAPADVDAVVAHLAEVASDAFSFPIRLAGTGTFRPVTQVVFVNVAAGATDCEALSRNVRRGILAGATKYPYAAHVTVAHDLADDALDRASDELRDFTCEFEAAGFSLFVFDEHGGWQRTNDFALLPPRHADAHRDETRVDPSEDDR